MKLKGLQALPVKSLKSMLDKLESQISLRYYNVHELGDQVSQLKLHINMRQVLDGKKFKNYHEAEAIILDELINIDEETELLAEIKDVKDELNIMLTLLQEQEDVLKKLYNQDMHDILSPSSLARIDRILNAKEDEIERLTKHADKVHEAVSSPNTSRDQKLFP